MASFGGSGFADPLHAEVNSILAIRQTNNLIETQFRTDVCELCPVPADVDSASLFRKDLTATIGAENTYRDFDLLPGLATPAHQFE